MNKRLFLWMLAGLAIVVVAAPTLAETATVADAPQRQAVLDAARAAAAQGLGKPLRLQPQRLVIDGGWALLLAAIQAPDGQPLNYTGTRYEEAVARGLKSKRYATLLRQSDNTWQVVTERIGPTDVAWAGWQAEYGAPAALFPALGPATTSTPSGDSQAIARGTLKSPPATGGLPAAWFQGLHQSMRYAAFRKQLLADGWQPHPNKSCMVDVVGANHASLCAQPDAPAQCTLCSAMPELEACSTDGYCRMRFTHPHSRRTLLVSSYGSTRHWQQPDSNLLVTGWRLTGVPADMRLRIAPRQIACYQLPCPFQDMAITPADNDALADPLYTGKQPPPMRAKENQRARVNRAWQTRQCLLIEGHMTAPTTPPGDRPRQAPGTLIVRRVLGACERP